MKKLIIILAMAFGAASCNFLDVIPEGKPTIDDLYKTHIQTDEFASSTGTCPTASISSRRSRSAAAI